MPFLRILRDKRGHETTYLMHLFRDGAKSRSRVLYMFRSPQGLGLGGRALDGDARATLARLYPDVPFDWRELVAHQQVVELAEPFRPRRRKRAEGEAETAVPEAEDAAGAPPTPAVPAQSTKAPLLPPEVAGETADEQRAFLTEWHPKVGELIAQRVHDEVRREALTALTARLDPSAWAADVAPETALADAKDAWERLVKVFSHRRRRGRRRSGGGAASKGPGESGPGSTPA